MKAKSALIASIATIGIASSANAQTYTSAGGTPIVFGTQSVDIVVADSGSIVDLDVTTNFGLHTWAGDVNASITHVDTGTTVSLFNQIGGPPSGDSSDLAGAYRFDDASLNNIWTAAGATTGPIPTGTYFASGVGGVQTFLSAFNGESITGTWRLTLTDTFAGTDGTLTNFSIHAVVPAPGALCAIGLAGLFGRGRRRS